MSLSKSEISHDGDELEPVDEMDSELEPQDESEAGDGTQSDIACKMQGNN